MELSERYIQKLESEGFTHVYDWQDAANTIYKEHAHGDKTVIIITDGSMEVTLDGEKKVLSMHDRLDIPPKVKHSVIVGPSGCGYVVGAMNEEDS